MGFDVSDLARLGPAAQKQVLQQMGKKQLPKESKLHNTPADRTMPNGKVHTFPSQREARRYDELALMLKAGKIRNLRLQQRYTLQESYISAEGDRVRAICYDADFVYEETGKWPETVWQTVVEDAKGMRTEKYKMKAKMMQAKFGITIREV